MVVKDQIGTDMIDEDLREDEEMPEGRLCSCGLHHIRQKYFSKCVHCKAEERRQRKESKRLVKVLQAALS